MNISFNLKDQKAEVSAVRLIITHKGKVYRKYTGISVKTKQWRKNKSGQWPTNPDDSDKLKRIKLGLEERLNEYSTESEILLAIDEVLSQKSKYYTPIQAVEKRPTFWGYFDDWSQKEVPAKRQRRNAYTLIGNLMGKSADWEEVNEAYYFRLVQKMNDQQYSKNYQGSIISKLRTVMSEGYKQKYHRNESFQTFKKFVEQPDTVYLTSAEIDKLWHLELKDEMEKKVRDLFLIGVYTAARFSDYSKLSKDNIRNGYITFNQQKTADSVVIPLSPRVAEILKRNGGHAPVVNQVVFNREIKTVCMRAGIKEKVQVTKSKGMRHETTTEPKWKLVSSHTARRTGATLLYKAGVPSRQVMLITGHKSEQAFRSYIRITKEENAEQLKNLPFFKQYQTGKKSAQKKEAPDHSRRR